MTYDLIVIGSGPGGYSAAVRAGQYGLKTAIVEKDPKLGGTCLHVGCIPTKALLHTADLWEHFVNPGDEGIACENPRLDYAKGAGSQEQDRLETRQGRRVPDEEEQGGLGEGLRDYPAALGSGSAPGRSEIGNGRANARNQECHHRHGIGSAHASGLEPDAETILTNIEILDLPVIPKTMLIIGAGAVGVEFASIFNRFGTKVTVLEMLPRLVPVEDEEVSKELERYFKKTGIRCETGAKAENITRTENGVRLCAALANGKREDMEAETLLVAVGRKPNTDNIGLDKLKVRAGSRLHQSGRVSADRRAGRLRDRRCGGWNAATGARGDHGRHDRGRAYGGQAVPSRSIGIAFPDAPTPSQASAASDSPKRRRARRGSL